jgi:hypothetical protein
MRKIIMMMFVASIALSLGGCSWMKKVGNKIKGGNKAKTEQTKDAPAKSEMKAETKTAAKPAAKKKGKGKRIYCSKKKTYEKGTPCWHWKRGARIGKPGYGGKKKPDAK